MEHTNNLNTLLDLLKPEHDVPTQIELLQKIGGLLVSDYVIQVKDQILEPLWVEAYYFSQEKFSDCNCHLHEKQKDHFQQLYVHGAGVDLCLSNGDFYLSYLLKMAYLYPEGKRAEKQFCKQIAVRERLLSVGAKEELEDGSSVVLVPRETGHTVRYAKRINMARPCYRDAPLAAFALDEIAGNPFDGFRGSLQDPAVAYMKEYMSSHPNGTRKEYEAECYRVFDWMPVAIYDLLRNLP